MKWFSGVLATVVGGVLIYYLTVGLQQHQNRQLTPSRRCTISGTVFHEGSRRPFPGAWIDVYNPRIQRGVALTMAAATTGPDGRFSFHCEWIEESWFPVMLVVRWMKDGQPTSQDAPQLIGHGGDSSINIYVSESN